MPTLITQAAEKLVPAVAREGVVELPRKDAEALYRTIRRLEGTLEWIRHGISTTGTPDVAFEMSREQMMGIAEKALAFNPYTIEPMAPYHSRP